MILAIPASAYAEPTVSIVTLEDKKSTSAHPQVLALRSPVLAKRLQNGNGTPIRIPDYDMEIFSVVLKWMYSDTVSPPQNNNDVILLMQAYAFAHSYEMPDTCTEIMTHISKWHEWNRLDLDVIDETAFIPIDCDLRTFLTWRLVEELEYLEAEGVVPSKVGSEHSIWLEQCVFRHWTEAVTRRRLKERTSPTKPKTRRVERKFLTEEQKEKRDNWAAYSRAGQMLSTDSVKIINMNLIRHDAIEDEDVLETWTNDWNEENSRGDWACDQDEGQNEDECDINCD